MQPGMRSRHTTLWNMPWDWPSVAGGALATCLWTPVQANRKEESLQVTETLTPMILCKWTPLGLNASPRPKGRSSRRRANASIARRLAICIVNALPNQRAKARARLGPPPHIRNHVQGQHKPLAPSKRRLVTQSPREARQPLLLRPQRALADSGVSDEA